MVWTPNPVGLFRAFTISAVATLLMVGGCNPHTSDRDIKSISVADARRLVTDSKRKPKPDLVLLIDPRSEPEFLAGHIPGARHLLLSDVTMGRPADRAIDRFSNIIVYGTDPASAPARGMTKRLISSGYDDVYLLDGGLVEWESQGGEVVRGDRAPQP